MIRQTRPLFLLGLVAALSTTLSVAPTSIAAQPAAARSAGSVMVHLGSFTNDLHAAKMALKVATAMRQQGASVVLFVDREGVRLADTRQPLGLIYGDGESFEQMYNAFIAAGGTVLVCPHCAKEAGMTASTLRKGATLAKDASELAKAILNADRVIDF
jgi:sulfur relay (sulfurtransferase) complex TusBCD TusD component (DsrE family)